MHTNPLHRGIVCLVVGLALGGAVGCDKVFGLDRPPSDAASDAAIDAPPDAPPDAHVIGVAGQLKDFAIDTDPSGAPLAILDVRNASATIVGTPHTFVPYTLVAPSGAFAPASGEIEIGDGGSIILASTFTASGTPVSPASAALMSGQMSKTTSAATVGLVRFGAITQNGFTSMGAGELYGSQVTQLVGSHYLKRIGVVVGVATNAYLGVYGDSGGSPTGLLEMVGPVALTAGSNELAITNVVLPPTFWIVAVLETAQPSSSFPTGMAIATDRYFILNSTYGPLPASIVAPTLSTFSRYMQYVQATP